VSVAPDGSPVELYLRLPPLGEAELVHGLVPAGADILELGCGVGRVTHELVRLRHRVVAVDESTEMLAHVRGAERVRSTIQELALDRRFPCVLLMSHLVNDDEARAGLLQACARHVTEDGVVLVERHPPGWQPEAGERRRLEGGVVVSLEAVAVEPPFVAATVRYEAAGTAWLHPFRARLLDDDELDAELRAAGLRLVCRIGDAGAWVEARLYSSASSCVTSPAL
jgi:SAM-dependent methyltransferase